MDTVEWLVQEMKRRLYYRWHLLKSETIGYRLVVIKSDTWNVIDSVLCLLLVALTPSPTATVFEVFILDRLELSFILYYIDNR